MTCRRSTPACAGITARGLLRSEHVSGLPPPARGSLRTGRVRHARLTGSTPACAGITVQYAGTHDRRYGLPPPARGPLDAIACGVVGVRSTPACAGITRSVRSGPLVARSTPACAGITSHAPTSDDRHRRSTPACAGITVPRARPGASHAGLPPPARGSPVLDRPAGTERGLPPPARGPLVLRRCPRRRGRSTPACAGITTRRPRARVRMIEVYPRLRGDHCPERNRACSTRGLPPPARGPPLHGLLTIAASRSTPACAGTTSSTMRRPRHQPAVYPRLRGDHPIHAPQAGSRTGLPPPARGSRPALDSSTSAVCGLPPPARGPPARGACDGRGPVYPRLRGDHRSPVTPLRARTAVHPRLRGDHDTTIAAAATDGGLPPPARGPRADV